MSADLLAAFGTETPTESAKASKPFPGSVPAQVQTHEDNTWQPWPKASQQVLRHEQGELWHSQNQGNDVLFDADEEDFGDFANAEQDDQTSTVVSTAGASSGANVDLLGLNDSVAETRSPTTRLNTVSQPSQPNIQQIAEKTVSEHDDWGAFQDIPSSEVELHQPIRDKQATPIVEGPAKTKLSSSGTARTSQTKSIDTTPWQDTASDEFADWDTWENDNTKQASTEPTSSLEKINQITISDKQERPTNVPPPAVLLSLAHRVFTVLSARTSSPESTTDTGLQAVTAYRVCARLIAGRSLRWKRDTILAQSMRIGAAGRSGGMKLTTLDKGESRKEEQEVEETLSTWSRHSLKLNAAMSRAKTQKPPLSLSTNIAVRTATGPDVINATHPCPICGLRRNERINGIDVNVSDTFGEWWIEHWGHRDCHDFWFRHNSLLEQR